LAPPPPPPDPFECRPIQFRFDRLVSEDGRLMEVRRIPQWVDVVGREDIEEWRPLNLGDLLRRLPNVMIADGGSPFMALPQIRGLGGDRVRVMTDGVWPSSQSLGVAGATLSLWDPESTERVEVYHGPGAYLRGAEAGGGTINVVPMRPHRHEQLSDAWGTEAASYRSADNAWRERIAADFGSGRVAALTGVTYERHDDRDTPTGTLDPSSYSYFAADAAVDYFLDNQSTVGFTGQYVRGNDIRSPLGGGGLLAQPDYQRLFLGLTFSSLDMGSYFHGTRATISFDTFAQADDQQTNLGLSNGITSKDRVRRFDFHLGGNLYLFDCHDTWAELSVGYAHLERTEAVLCLNTPIPGTVDAVKRLNIFPDAVPGACVAGSSTFDANEWVVKALIEDEWHEGCWDIHVGARVDYHYLDDSRTGDQLNEFIGGVAAGVCRHLSECTTVYANGSYGQRFPTIAELYSVSILNGVTVFGNPDLNNETSWALEGGLKYTSGNHWTLQASSFVHGISDFIGRAPLGTDDVWDNLGTVTMYGAEVTGAYRPRPCGCEGLEFFGMAGTTGTSDDKIVSDVPLHGRLGARFSNARGCEGDCGLRRWFAEGSMRGGTASGFKGDDAPFVTTELLGGMGWSRGGRRDVWLRVGVMNLFDEKYVEPFSRLPAYGRSLVASLQIDF
jgi:outer membrane receptor protein involved in Fe transport